MNNFQYPQNQMKIAEENGVLTRPWFNLFFNLFQAFNSGSLSGSVWTPVDSSADALTFSSVSSTWTQVGNLVHAYATWTYPVTAGTEPAGFDGLPGQVPNEQYALNGVIFKTTGTNAKQCLLVPSTYQGSFTDAVLSPVTNAQMSGTIVRLMAIYPLA